MVRQDFIFGVGFDPAEIQRLLDSLRFLRMELPSAFKPGDKVTLHDYSYSLGYIDGKLVHEAAGCVLGHGVPSSRKVPCEVIATGLGLVNLPTYNGWNPAGDPPEHNDAIILHRPSGTIFFTQERFLRAAPVKCTSCGYLPSDPNPPFIVAPGRTVAVYSFQGVQAFNRSSGRPYVTPTSYVENRKVDKTVKLYTVLSTDNVLDDCEGGRTNNVVLMDRGCGDILYISRCYLLQPKCLKCGHVLDTAVNL